MVRLLVVCTMFLVADAAAQVQPSPVDLKASYCLIVNANELAIQKKLLDSVPANDIDMREQAQLPIDETSHRIDSLRSYLAPRAPHEDQTALTAAQRQADDDLSTIASDSVRSCAQRCGALPQAQNQMSAYATCTQACAPEPLTRIRACTDISWLPK